MPLLSRSQLHEMSQDPGTSFFIWEENPSSRYYHMMILSSGRCLALRAGWEVHDDFTLGPVEITRRYVDRFSWVSSTREQFCSVMAGYDNPRGASPSAKASVRFHTNHKIGAPKGKLP